MTSISEKNKLQPHFMDRHKQQIKRDRQDLKRRAINSQNKSRMRTLIKNVLSSLGIIVEILGFTKIIFK